MNKLAARSERTAGAVSDGLSFVSEAHNPDQYHKRRPNQRGFPGVACRHPNQTFRPFNQIERHRVEHRAHGLVRATAYS